MKNKIKSNYMTTMFLGSLVVFCLTANFSAAESSDLVISEIMYSPPGTDDKHEWIEIYNPNSSAISIPKNSLGIIDEPEERDENGKLKNTCHTFSEDLKIDAGDFIIIADDKATFQDDYPDFMDKVLDTTVKLANSEDEIRISFDKCQTWAAAAKYENDSGADGNGKTLERTNSDEPREEALWRESFACHGTPGEKSSEKTDFPNNLRINELLPHPGNSEKEFIELFNPNAFKISLDCWLLKDKSDTQYSLTDKLISETDYLLIDDLGFKLNDTKKSDEQYAEEVFLINPAGEIADQVSYSDSAKENQTYAFWSKIFFWTLTPTPGKENLITKEPEIGANYSLSDKIFLSEILPNPKGDESGEYIELINHDSAPIDLFGWTLRDESKTSKFVLKESQLISPEEFLVIPKSRFKFSLNNTAETVYLFDPQNKLISSIAYSKAPENVSFNFDEDKWPINNAMRSDSGWRWSKFLTPGKKNRLDSTPKITLKRTRKVYKNLSASFKVKATDKETKNLKYVWDFGDGHKSYLEETTHKYEKTGKYRVSLAVKDESQTITRSFLVQVKKYPRPELEIIELHPNPEGRDTDSETLVIRNNSGKTIDLLNYKIATGTVKPVNHPINESMEIAAGESRTIKRINSRFSLPNKTGIVQLVYPDGKLADEVSYQKAKIAEGEIYRKIDDQWQWTLKGEPTDDDSENNTEPSEEETSEELEGEVAGAATFSLSSLFATTRAEMLIRADNFLETTKKLQSQETKGKYCPVQRNRYVESLFNFSFR